MTSLRRFLLAFWVILAAVLVTIGTAADHASDVARSPRWPSVRAAYLAEHPTCAACGGPADTVHHVVPVHKDRSRELDIGNLVALCDRHGCHFAFGHCYDWRAYNPHVREDAAEWLAKARRHKRE